MYDCLAVRHLPFLLVELEVSAEAMVTQASASKPLVITEQNKTEGTVLSQNQTLELIVITAQENEQGTSRPA